MKIKLFSMFLVLVFYVPTCFAHGSFSGGFNTGLGFGIGQGLSTFFFGPRYYPLPPAAYYPAPAYPGYGYYGYGGAYPGYGYIPPTLPGQVIIVSPAAPPSNSMILGR